MTDRAAQADQIKADIDRRERGESEWRMGTFDLCLHLAQTRASFDSNSAFHDWLIENKLGDDVLGKNDRAAAIAMGQHPEIAKAVLEKTERRSLRLIHEEEFRIPSTGNTEAEAKPTGKLKKDGTMRMKAGRKKGAFRKPLSAADEARIISMLFEQGKTREEVVEAFKGSGLKVNNHIVDRVRDLERGRRQEQSRAEADPIIDPTTLSKSAQEKLEAAKRQWLKAWEREKSELIRLEVVRRIEENLLPFYKEKFDRAEQIEKMLFKRGKGVMTENDFITVLRCLHSDNSASTQMRDEAFKIFNGLKLSLVIPKELAPVSPSTFPKTYAEMMAMKDAATAARKAAYARRKNGGHAAQAR